MTSLSIYSLIAVSPETGPGIFVTAAPLQFWFYDGATPRSREVLPVEPPE